MKLPLVSSRQLVNALERDGFKRGPGRRGSHQPYVKEVKEADPIVVIVLEGKKEIARGTLKKI